MIIGISGKIGSGKDTVGKIIQYLTCPAMGIQIEMKDWINKPDYNNFRPDWQIVKFADKLKDIVCILTGCTREQLEDIDFKNTLLSDEWIRYGKANGFYSHSDNNPSHKIMDNKQCSKEEYEEELKVNWQTAYKTHFTYRELLQQLGTNLLRNQLHENVWVNALFSSYKNIIEYPKYSFMEDGSHIQTAIIQQEVNYPNWIITDVRFLNEAKAIKDRGGIVIRVNRNDYIFDNKGKRIIPSKSYINIDTVQHSSETALDDYDFDYVINNDTTFDTLISNVHSILVKENII